MRRIIPYSDEELRWIKANARRPRRQAHEEFCRLFQRSDILPENYKSLCHRKGWSTGRTGHYAKGSVPANKGKTMPYNENSARTRFKKGQPPPNTKYLGHERVSKDGYVEISIDETNPHTGFHRRYVLKHKHLWEKQHGPVPDGMCLKCLDGNRQNTDPANWEAIPRAALPFLNGHRGPNYETAALELKPTVLAIAKLKTTRHAKARARRQTTQTESEKAPQMNR